MRYRFLAAIAAVCAVLPLTGQVRSEKVLKDWEFRHDHDTTAVSGWEKVRIPHDWAIYGPFDKSNDFQIVALYGQGLLPDRH